MNPVYDESSIKVLADYEHVRTRPLMYISSERPLYQMFTEILDNSIDEAMNDHAKTIRVEIDYEKDTVLVTDDGRGLPQGMNTELKKPTPIVIYTKLNSGGKYNLSNYGKSSGLHGVGSTVVNALSEILYVKTWRDDSMFEASFAAGQEVNHEIRKETGATKTGTTVFFKPDKSLKLLEDQSLEDYRQAIEDRLALLPTIVPGLKIFYNGDEVVPRDFSTFVPEIKEPLFDTPISFYVDDLLVSMNWAEENNKSAYKAFCNSLFNPNGGDQEKGVYQALVEATKNDDVVLGLNFSVSVMYPGVEYDSQAKLKAVSKDMREFVKTSLVDQLKDYFKKFPDVKEAIIKLAVSKRTALNKKNNKGAVRRNNKSAFMSVLGSASFADASTSDRSLAELYIVEGNSAAGSAAQSRDTQTQAILPLRGKVVNAETADVASLLKNAEIGTLVSSIDAGIFEDLNVAKSRYSKIIIMADADEDGKHIASTLIGFFMNAMTDLVEQGYVYLALPPLYGTTDKQGNFIPINDEATRDEYLAKGSRIVRFKGLGEMNPHQLEVACMDPKTRMLVQVTMTKQSKALVASILGGDSSVRKNLLMKAGILQ